MEKKTQDVEDLVSEVLRTMSRPYGEDVIEDVFLKIEKRSLWLTRYERLARELGKESVNQWIGQYTKQITNMDTASEVEAKRSKLITSYSKLQPKAKRVK